MLAEAAAGLLIVIPEDLEPGIQKYLAHRQQDIPVLVLHLEHILDHDEESRGNDDAERLKHHIYDAWKHDGIRYVLLVGDADVMPVRYMCLDRKTEAAFNYAFYPSDLYYADLAHDDGSFCDWNGADEDFHAHYFGEVRGEHNKDGVINHDGISYRPEVAVGRWPASTVEDVTAIAEKTIEYEHHLADGSHEGAGDAAFIMVDGWVDARPRLDAMAKSLGSDWTIERRFYGHEPEPSVEESVTLFNAGTGLIVHAGHGHDNAWADSLHTRNIKQMTNADSLPIVISAGCSTARFATLPPYEPYEDIHGKKHDGTTNKEVFTAPPPPPALYARESYNRTGLGERLVRTADIGAVAYIGCNTGSQPCGLTLVEGFVRGFNTEDARLGDAWMHAIDYYHDKERLAELTPTKSWYPPSIFFQGMKFMVYGDPSLKLPTPQPDGAQ